MIPTAVLYGIVIGVLTIPSLNLRRWIRPLILAVVGAVGWGVILATGQPTDGLQDQIGYFLMGAPWGLINVLAGMAVGVFLGLMLTWCVDRGLALLPQR